MADDNKQGSESKLVKFRDTAKKVTIGTIILTAIFAIVLVSYQMNWSLALYASYFNDLMNYTQGVGITGTITLACADIATISGFFWVASNLLLAYRDDKKE